MTQHEPHQEASSSPPDEPHLAPEGTVEHDSGAHELDPADRPRIYVASLSDYNNGRLHGVWLEATSEPSELHEQITAMLATSTEPGAEEYAIHDYENFGPAQIHEFDSIDLVTRLARGIAEHGFAFAAWADVHEGDEAQWDTFSEAYLGHFDSITDYADQLIDDLGYTERLEALVPDHLIPYVAIDTAQLGRDLYYGGDINTVTADDGGIWVFDGHA